MDGRDAGQGGPHRSPRVSVMRSNDTPERPEVVDRDAPVICEACGRAVARKARQQRYCSDRCRESCKKRSRKAGMGGYTGAPPKPPKSSKQIIGVRGGKIGSIPSVFAPAHILEQEVFAGRWERAVSSDGVAYLVRRRGADR